MEKAPPSGISSEFRDAGQPGYSNDPMTKLWNELEGVSFAGRYMLEQCLSTTDRDAWYMTRLEDGTAAAMRVMEEDGERLALWREALSVDHPNLVRMFDAGRTEVDSRSLIYAVCEFPDDFLAGVLQERPLSPSEAREVLRSALGGLRYLHGRGLVHRAVDPTHLMAFGESIKLPSDTWELPVQSGGPRRVGPYDAPETARGAITPASDVWSLAVTLHEVLTQKRPNLERESEFRSMAEPFATIMRRALVRAPEARWSVEDVERHLHPVERVVVEAPPKPVIAPAPATVRAPEVRPAPPMRAAETPPSRKTLPPAPPRHRADETVTFTKRTIPMWGVPVAGLVAALGLGIFFLRQPEKAAVAPAAPVTKSSPVAPKGERPSPMAPMGTDKKGSAEREDLRWRVIAFTYAGRTAAQKKADEVNRKHPQLHAEVFTPASEHGPFLISLGGSMTKAEAQAVLKMARAKGLPRDTFARNYVK